MMTDEDVSKILFSPKRIAELTKAQIDAHRSGEGASDFAFGFKPLDDYLNVKKGELIVVLARPSNGKSSMMVLAANETSKRQMARDPKLCPPIYVTLEMSVEELAIQSVSKHSRIDRTKIVRGEVDNWQFLYDTVDNVAASYPIIYVGHSASGGRGRPKLTMENIDEAIDRVVDKVGSAPPMIAIDYYQRCKLDRTTRDRRLDVSEVVEGSKDMALKYNTVVFAGSQGGRQIDQRTPPIPLASDAKETGNIEETTDILLSAFRPIKYMAEGEKIKKNNLTVTPNLFFSQVLKRRGGSSEMGFWGNFDMSVLSITEFESRYSED